MKNVISLRYHGHPMLSTTSPSPSSFSPYTWGSRRAIGFFLAFTQATGTCAFNFEIICNLVTNSSKEKTTKKRAWIMLSVSKLKRKVCDLVFGVTVSPALGKAVSTEGSKRSPPPSKRLKPESLHHIGYTGMFSGAFTPDRNTERF